LVYILHDDDPTGIEICRNLQRFNVI
jgi:hypothetical protein